MQTIAAIFVIGMIIGFLVMWNMTWFDKEMDRLDREMEMIEREQKKLMDASSEEE